MIRVSFSLFPYFSFFIFFFCYLTLLLIFTKMILLLLFISFYFHENYFYFLMFRDVSACSGMFRVPAFIDARLQRRLDHLQCLVKRTCWSDYVSHVDLQLSFFIITQKKDGNIARVLIILHHLTKLHAFMGKVKNTLRNIEKHCNAF